MIRINYLIIDKNNYILLYNMVNEHYWDFKKLYKNKNFIKILLFVMKVVFYMKYQ